MTSIIILTQNRLAHTKKCVKSIRKHTPETHEIIFVDNGSTDETVQWLQGQVKVNKNFCLIENQENAGLAKGRNQGINLSRGEFILLMDNDVIVSEGWLDGMLECLNRTPEAGIVGPITNNISNLQRVMDESYHSVDYLDKYAAKFKEQYRHRQIPYRNIAGFCMLFKHKLTEKIGLLDESFGAGHFEDEDFCLRAALADYRNYIAADVFIHHHGAKGPNGDRKLIEEKWVLSTSSPEGKKLAVLKTTEIADDLYQKGKVDQAAEALINCIKLTPEAKEIYYELARMFIESKRFAEALEVVESMPESAREELKGLECAGCAKEGLGLDDEAATYTDRMLSLDEKYPPALNLKGVLAYKQGDKETSVDYFIKAIDADPGYGEAHTNLGVLYWGLDNNKDEAFQHLKKGFVLSPTEPDACSLYYSVVSSLGIFSDAEADFRETSKLYQNNKNIAFLYIDILIQQDKFRIAMTEIEDAIAAFGLDEGTLNAALAVREKIGPRSIDKKNANNATLSLCIIVKNEEQHLVKCLKSVRDVVDEMIVVDTGSSDRTRDIATVLGAKVFDFPWTGDFSSARNHSLQQATGDWIFILDADEVISALDFDELKALIRKRSSSPAAYSVVTRNYTKIVSIIGRTPNSGQYPEEAGAGWIPSPKVRLFTNRKDIYFSDPVHELVEPSLKKAKIPIQMCNIVVHHYGKLDIDRDSQKGEDYYLLGKMKYENDPTNVKYINELAKQAQALNKHEEAIDLWLKLIPLLKTDPQSAAHKELASIVGTNPEAEAYMQLALSYHMLDRHEDALTSSRKGMEYNITLKEFVLNYAHFEIIAGSLDKAFTTLKDLLKTTPDYTLALILLAIIFCIQGKTEKAQEFLQPLLNKGLTITPGLNKIAKQLHAQGKRDEALLILNATIENRINDQETMSLYDALHESHSSA